MESSIQMLEYKRAWKHLPESQFDVASIQVECRCALPGMLSIAALACFGKQTICTSSGGWGGSGRAGQEGLPTVR